MVKSIKLKLRSPFRNEDIFCADTKTVNEFMKQVRIFRRKKYSNFFSLMISEKNLNKFLFFWSFTAPVCLSVIIIAAFIQCLYLCFKKIFTQNTESQSVWPIKFEENKETFFFSSSHHIEIDSIFLLMIFSIFPISLESQISIFNENRLKSEMTTSSVVFTNQFY